MQLPYGLTALCWIVFLVVWLVSAFTAKRSTGRSTRWIWGMVIRLIILVAVIELYKSPSTREFLLHEQAYVFDPLIQWLGVVLCACGVAFAIWARFNLGRNWGMPMAVKQDAELVTTGPYAYVRHPIYTGMIVAMIGTTLVIIWWIIPLIGSFIYFVYSAKNEEKLMLNEFPDQYPAYMKRTKMLIPFVF